MKLIILGAGGYGRTVADIARQSGKYTEVYFLDDNATDEHASGNALAISTILLLTPNYIRHSAIMREEFSG